MKFKYGDIIKVTKGFNKGRIGKIKGKILFIYTVLFDNQCLMTNMVFSWNLKKI